MDRCWVTFTSTLPIRVAFVSRDNRHMCENTEENCVKVTTNFDKHCLFCALQHGIWVHIFFFCGAATQCGSRPPHSWGFLDHTQRRTTVGRTPLYEWSARCRDLYLTTHNTHNRQTSMPPVGFEPAISAGERPQTYALDRATTGTGIWVHHFVYDFKNNPGLGVNHPTILARRLKKE